MRTLPGVALALATLVAAQPARAEDPPADRPATAAEVQALAAEVRRLEQQVAASGASPAAPTASPAGPVVGAEKAFEVPAGVSIGGYAEAVYRNVLDADSDQSDLYRVVLYLGYRFSDRIVFNSEIEFEHGGSETGVEFAYLDFELSEPLHLRAGNLLVPVGRTNEAHEPPFFFGVFRPEVERSLIPTTWSENGAGARGVVGGLGYQAYLLTGLDVFEAGTMRASTWIRGARTGGAESRANTAAGVLALEYALGPATLGASLYSGRADQRTRTATGEPILATVTLAEGHASVQWRGLTARALYVGGWLGDADLVSAELGLAGTAVLGSQVRGGYLEAGYDLLTLGGGSRDASLVPFVRLEAMDLHAAVPTGGARDPALDQRILTAGVNWLPHPNVVIKADVQRRTDASAAPAVTALDLGVGLVF